MLPLHKSSIIRWGAFGIVQWGVGCIMLGLFGHKGVGE